MSGALECLDFELELLRTLSGDGLGGRFVEPAVRTGQPPFGDAEGCGRAALRAGEVDNRLLLDLLGLRFVDLDALNR